MKIKAKIRYLRSYLYNVSCQNAYNFEAGYREAEKKVPPLVIRPLRGVFFWGGGCKGRTPKGVRALVVGPLVEELFIAASLT